MEVLELNTPELTETLRVDGKLVFPLLSAEQVEALIALFHEHHATTPEGFYATTHTADKQFRQEVSDQILAVISDEVKAIFKNMQLLGGAFISKAPGEKGILPLHQDWNIVNEKEARSYNLWIPLVDVNPFNGAMRILEKSHLKQETYRGPNIHPVLYPISAHVDRQMVSLDMSAGQGLIYDHALWHSSPMNQSTETRLAVVFGVIPEGVEMKFYHKKNELTIEEYISRPNFFFENDPQDGPKGLEKKREFAHSTEALTREQFDEIYLGIKQEEPLVTKRKRGKGFFGLFKRHKA